MRIKRSVSNSSAFNTPPKNACNKCWDTKRGVYMSFPVFIEPDEKDKPMLPICFKAVCPICGDMQIYPRDGYQAVGIYDLVGEKADFKLQYWAALKALNIDIAAFERLLLEEPRRRYYVLEELPKRSVIGHRAEFYEPKGRADQPELPI